MASLRWPLCRFRDTAGQRNPIPYLRCQSGNQFDQFIRKCVFPFSTCVCLPPSRTEAGPPESPLQASTPKKSPKYWSGEKNFYLVCSRTFERGAPWSWDPSSFPDTYHWISAPPDKKHFQWLLLLVTSASRRFIFGLTFLWSALYLIIVLFLQWACFHQKKYAKVRKSRHFFP